MSDPKKYRIPVILPENPVTVLTESAALLSAKLALAEKINLPSVTLGKTDGEPQEVTSMRATLTNDGYLLYRDKKSLYISGKTDRGTRQGVICFLTDYLGCRFFVKDCEVMLPDAAREIPEFLRFTYNPTFDFRCSFYKLALADPEYDKLHKLNPIRYARGMRVHTFYDLAEMPGTREENIGVQPCLCDENVYRTVLGNVRKWLLEEPDATVISVSQNDSYEHQLGCHCEKCAALNARYGTEGGALFAFVNRIAREIKPEFPNVLIETLAYRYSVTPPQGMTFEDNVLVQLCVMDACYNHRIDDQTCPQNYRFAEFFENWAKVCSHLSVWDYHVDFAFYQTIFPNYSILYDHITYYAAHNVVSVFNEGNFNSFCGQFEELRSYICSELMWNPHMNREAYTAMIDEFCRCFYGDGWAYIRTFMEQTESIAKGDGKRHFSLYASPDSILPYDAEQCDDLLALFEKALAAAQTPAQKKHVRKASIQALYYRQYCTNSHDSAPNERLYRLMKEADIERITEGAPLREITDFAASVRSW